jgi:hypothetical protein
MLCVQEVRNSREGFLMTIHDLYEQSWAERHDCTPDSVKSFRLSNGSYGLVSIAAGFRHFKAGYEAAQSKKQDDEIGGDDG